MARPVRIEFEGALYHVMARGNARVDIFLDDKDCQASIENLGRVCERFGMYMPRILTNPAACWTRVKQALEPSAP